MKICIDIWRINGKPTNLNALGIKEIIFYFVGLPWILQISIQIFIGLTLFYWAYSNDSGLIYLMVSYKVRWND